MKIGQLWRKQKASCIALAVLVIIIAAAIAAPLVYNDGPLAMNAVQRLQGPSSLHLLGTDEYGRDVLSRTCYGIRISMFIGLIVVLLSTISGIAVGLLCGYYPAADRIISRILDGLMAFPEIILAITLAAIWGAGTGNIIFGADLCLLP